MELINFIKNNTELSEELANKLEAAFDRKELPKGTQLFVQGSHCKKVFYFEKGLGRVYYLKDGKDITHYFFFEDSFSAPIESVFYNQPSHCTMELLENSIVRSINYSELEEFIGQLAPIGKAVPLILIGVLRAFSDRLYTIQFQTAQERYNRMLENYPNIFLRAPLGQIASYLGITQETLSRIRAGK